MHQLGDGSLNVCTTDIPIESFYITLINTKLNFNSQSILSQSAIDRPIRLPLHNAIFLRSVPLCNNRTRVLNIRFLIDRESPIAQSLV